MSAFRYLPVGPVLLVCALGTLASVTVFALVARRSGLLSLLVELSQLMLGRSVDVDDVLLNSCGAALGATVAALASYRRRRVVAS